MTDYHSQEVANHTAKYRAAVQASASLPFTLPFGLLGYALLITYLLLPPNHYLRRLKHVVCGIIVWHSMAIVFTCHSLSMAYGIYIGLAESWCILIAANLMVFNDHKTFSRLIQGPHHDVFINSSVQDVKSGDVQVELAAGKHDTNHKTLEERSSNGNTITAERPADYSDYIWQPMPSKFWERLGWVLDLLTSPRGIHWSFNPTSENGQSSARPLATKSVDNLAARLCRFLISYLSIDVLKVLMVNDPYFLGMIKDTPALPHLRILNYSPLTVHLYRTLLSFAAIYGAIYFISTLGPLFLSGLLGPTILGIHGEQWMYPSAFGPFCGILDEGILGFWGTWWHQSFRFVFVSAGKWMNRQICNETGTAAAKLTILISAFVLSGLVHACGVYTLIGVVNPLGTFLFFALQPVGIYLQILILPRFGNSQRSSNNLTRALKFTWTLIWLGTTFPLFADGLAEGGLWLFEPLPISPLRGSGIGVEERQWVVWQKPTIDMQLQGPWWRRGLII